jgi:hypothetical protein
MRSDDQRSGDSKSWREEGAIDTSNPAPSLHA